MRSTREAMDGEHPEEDEGENPKSAEEDAVGHGDGLPEAPLPSEEREREGALCGESNEESVEHARRSREER